MNYQSHDLCSQSQHWSQAKGHANALVLFAFPHEPHVPVVSFANEEVHVEVTEVDLCHQVVVTDKPVTTLALSQKPMNSPQQRGKRKSLI